MHKILKSNTKPPRRVAMSDEEVEHNFENNIAVAKWLRRIIDESEYDDTYIAERLTFKLTKRHFQKKLSEASFQIGFIREVLNILRLKVIVKSIDDLKNSN